MRLVLLFLVTMGLAAGPAYAKCIGVIPAGSTHQFWQDLSRGAHAAADDLGVELVLRAPGDDETTLQLRLILSLWKHGCNAFVVAPNDDTINEVVASLETEGVPTVYVDRDTSAKSKIVSLVMTDNYRAGRVAAEQVAERLPPEARVVLFGLKKGITSTDDRERGFADYMREIGRPVAVHRYVGVSREEAAWHITDFFQRQNNPPVDALFTPNEGSTEAAIRALDALLEDGTLAKRPLHLGFDMSTEIQQAVSDARVEGVIVQDPFEMGYRGVVLANQARQGERVLPRVNPPFRFITGAVLN